MMKAKRCAAMAGGSGPNVLSLLLPTTGDSTHTATPSATHAAIPTSGNHL